MCLNFSRSSDFVGRCWKLFKNVYRLLLTNVEMRELAMVSPLICFVKVDDEFV